MITASLKTTTKPKATSPVKLPKLKYGVFNANGELLRTMEIPDQREAICRIMNERLTGGKYARPITD